MNLTIITTTTETTSKTHSMPAVVLADIIAGRPLAEDVPAAVNKDVAFAAATAFFAGSSITNLESYLKHRASVKKELRETAARIRALKATLRPMDGLSQGFTIVQSDLSSARASFAEMHDTRVLGKAWSAEARRRNDLEAEAAA